MSTDTSEPDIRLVFPQYCPACHRIIYCLNIYDHFSTCIGNAILFCLAPNYFFQIKEMFAFFLLYFSKLSLDWNYRNSAELILTKKLWYLNQNSILVVVAETFMIELLSSCTFVVLISLHLRPSICTIDWVIPNKPFLMNTGYALSFILCSSHTLTAFHLQYDTSCQALRYRLSDGFCCYWPVYNQNYSHIKHVSYHSSGPFYRSTTPTLHDFTHPLLFLLSICLTNPDRNFIFFSP